MKQFVKDGKVYIMEATQEEIEQFTSEKKQRMLKHMINQQLIIAYTQAVKSYNNIYGILSAQDLAMEIFRRMSK